MKGPVMSVFVETEEDLEIALLGKPYKTLYSGEEDWRLWCDDMGEVVKTYRVQWEYPASDWWWLEVLQTDLYLMHPEHGEVHVLDMRLRHSTGALYRSLADFERWYEKDRELLERPDLIAFLQPLISMDLTYKDGMGDLFHFPGWARHTLSPEAKAVIKRAGFQNTLTSTWEDVFQFKCKSGGVSHASDSLLVIPLFPCYVRERQASWRCVGVDNARVSLTTERKFIDAWELLERSVFNTEYLDTVHHFDWGTSC